MKKIIMLIVLSVFCLSCDDQEIPTSSSGVSKAEVSIETNPNGLTTEQQNIKDRLEEDNKPGAIKHLYVISAYSGQVIIYSTVRGKITSSGKRLTPITVTRTDLANYNNGFGIKIGDRKYVTDEVLQDDGSYGSSSEYIFWWDIKGIYHQHFISGGQIIHVSSEPLSVKGVIINMDISQKDQQ